MVPPHLLPVCMVSGNFAKLFVGWGQYMGVHICLEHNQRIWLWIKLKINLLVFVTEMTGNLKLTSLSAAVALCRSSLILLKAGEGTKKKFFLSSESYFVNTTNLLLLCCWDFDVIAFWCLFIFFLDVMEVIEIKLLIFIDICGN